MVSAQMGRRSHVDALWPQEPENEGKCRECSDWADSGVSVTEEEEGYMVAMGGRGHDRGPHWPLYQGSG